MDLGLDQSGSKIEDMIKADLGFPEVGPVCDRIWVPCFADEEKEEKWGFGLEPPPECQFLLAKEPLAQLEVKSKSEHSGVRSGQVHFECDPDSQIPLTRRCSDPFPRVSETEALKLEIKALERKLAHREQRCSRRTREFKVAQGLELQLMQAHDVDAPPVLSVAETTIANLTKKYGSLKNAARVKAGCLDLQKAIEAATPALLYSICRDLLGSMAALANDFFGNYVVQCIIKKATEAPLIQDLCAALSPEFAGLSKTQTGTRVVQSLLVKCFTDAQRAAVCRGLVPCLPDLCMDPVGTYVVQKAIEVLPPPHKEYLLTGLHGRVVAVSKDKNGACAVRTCIRQVTGESRRLLIVEAAMCAYDLSVHMFGNYVVQAALEGECQELILALLKDVVKLAKNKHGSNVVEHLLKKRTPQRPVVMDLVIANARELAMDTFGNFVVQTAVSSSTDQEFPRIHSALNSMIPQLSQFKQGRALIQVLRGKSSSMTSIP